MTLDTPTVPAELANSDGETWYYLDATHNVQKTVDLSAQVGSVGWSIDWVGTPSVEEKIAAATKTAVFTIAKTQGRIHFLTNDTAIKNNAMANNFAVTVTVGADGSLSYTGSSTTSSGTLYFYVDGTATANDGAGPLTGLTIAATAA